VERGSHWLTVRIKNTGDKDLQNLNVKMHSLDSTHISFLSLIVLTWKQLALHGLQC
jgi:hypothetical protein